MFYLPFGEPYERASGTIPIESSDGIKEEKSSGGDRISQRFASPWNSITLIGDGDKNCLSMEDSKPLLMSALTMK